MGELSNDDTKQLWAAADQFRANADLKPSEYSRPVLGLLFLRYAEAKYAEAEERIGPVGSGGRRTITKDAYQAEGVIFLPPQSRFTRLQALIEGDDVGKAINEAMQAIEAENPDLAGVLPQNYNAILPWLLVELIRLLAPMNIDGDTFGRVYEYFMGKFAMMEMQKGGEFYTPASIVRLIVEIIEPYHGRIFDPACGSGGMFVQSAEFVANHQKDPTKEISVFGTEKLTDTIRLGTMNLAVHGLSGDLKVANSYYEDPHDALGRFDFVMANPPFNVDGVDKARLVGDPRFPFGLPSTDNGNYLWIQLFYSSLNETGRAGFVMANSAGDAGHSELKIRRNLIQTGDVDVVVSVGPNFFFTVTLPCTLWFFDKSKTEERKNTVLFVDARKIYRQIEKSRREFTQQQLEHLANIVRIFRGDRPENKYGGQDLLQENFSDETYVDVPGLCKVATLEEIEAHNWSLNPGRYVGVVDTAPDDFDFTARLVELNEELEQLNLEALTLEQRIADSVTDILGNS
jgi:type I restriction enzyme M protein